MTRRRGAQPLRLHPSEPYSSGELCRLADCTFRQLDYWCRSGHLGRVVTPGSGYPRTWTMSDVVTVARLARFSELTAGSRMHDMNPNLIHTLSD